MLSTVRTTVLKRMTSEKKDDGVQSVSDDGADKDNSGKIEDRNDTKDKDAAVSKKAKDRGEVVLEDFNC